MSFSQKTQNTHRQMPANLYHFKSAINYDPTFSKHNEPMKGQIPHLKCDRNCNDNRNKYSMCNLFVCACISMYNVYVLCCHCK